jgi:hypothetical protein
LRFDRSLQFFFRQIAILIGIGAVKELHHAFERRASPIAASWTSISIW